MPAQTKTWLTTARIETLTDGIFAITMTLLVLDLTVPPPQGGNPQDILHGYLQSDWLRLFSYAKSFLLLAVFWVLNHRQFHLIRRTDVALLWINIILLMFIALVPFSTTLDSEYRNVLAAALIFHSNLLAIGLTNFFLTYYAAHDFRLIDKEKVSEKRVSREKKRAMIMPGVALLAIVFSFISPAWSSAAYLIIPLLLRMNRLE